MDGRMVGWCVGGRGLGGWKNKSKGRSLRYEECLKNCSLANIYILGKALFM